MKKAVHVRLEDHIIAGLDEITEKRCQTRSSTISQALLLAFPHIYSQTITTQSARVDNLLEIHERKDEPNGIA